LGHLLKDFLFKDLTMGAIVNITVFDGAASPVSHTLNAISVVSQPDGSVQATWREALAGVPAYANVQVTAKYQPLKSGVTRVESVVEVPVMESVSGNNAQGYTAAPKVAYVNTIRRIGLFHQRSTVTDRRLARMIDTNLSNNVSTTFAAATTGPMPDLFDSLTCPT
jgi:hypothetical protein